MTETKLPAEIDAGSEVVVHDVRYEPTEGMDVEKLMHIAMEKEGNIDVIKELVKLRNDEMDRQAEEALYLALHQFKMECPPIRRSKKGATMASRDGTSNTLFYAPLDGIQEIVDPILHPLGLTYSWSNEVVDDNVVTRCILRHVRGATCESSMSLPVTGPPKSSATQARSGTRTFNKRITLSDVLGIATMDDGDGAEEVGGGAISADQKAVIVELFQSKDVDVARFLALLEVGSVDQIKSANYSMVVRLLEVKKDATE